jgi:hypothetical protein
LAGQLLAPHVLGVAEDRGDEAAALVLGRAGLAAGLLALDIAARIAARHHLGAADEKARVDAERPTHQRQHKHRPDAQTAAAGEPAAAPAHAAAVLDVIGRAEIVPAHRKPRF